MTTVAPHLTALADQLHAASADAERTLRAARRRATDVRLSHVRPHPWLADRAAALRLALTYGTAQLCPHIGPAPRVVHAAAWAPGRLVCPLCIALLRPTCAEDSTCDRCLRHASRLHAGIAAFGPILLGYGLCPDCQRDLDTAHQPTRKERHT